jgi:hypothetical protein
MTNEERDAKQREMDVMIREIHIGLLGDPAHPDTPGLYDTVRKSIGLIRLNSEAIRKNAEAMAVHTASCEIRRTISEHVAEHKQAAATRKKRMMWIVGLMLAPVLAVLSPQIVRMISEALVRALH